MVAVAEPGARGVVFDLDGTLVDTPRAITAILTKVLAGKGANPDEAQVRAAVGRPLGESLARLLALPADHADVAEVAAEYRRLFGEHLRDNASALLYPGVRDGLRRLRADGRLLGIATSKPCGAAQRILALAGIAGDFPVVAGDDSVPMGKPAPDMALHVAAELGLEPSACAVAGDGVADVAMGTAAGMRVIGVSYGVAAARELIGAGADRVADSFTELVDLLLASTTARASVPGRTESP